MTDPDRHTTLDALTDWARDQARARPRLVAAAWRAGAQNVAELARAAQVGRDTIYADLRAQGINYRHRDRRADYRLPAGPIYGLPEDWDGDRQLDGGYGRRPATGRTRLGRRKTPGPITWDGLNLLHRRGGSQLAIDSRQHPAADEPPRPNLDAATLQSLALTMNLAAVDAGEEPNPHCAADLAVNRRWESVDIPVDGAPAQFRQTTTGQHWAAYGSPTIDTDVILIATNFPLDDVRLERLTTLDPYLQAQP